MPLPDLVLNTNGISIARPLDHMSGGDSNKKIVHTGLRAHVRNSEEFILNPGSNTAERTIVLKLLMPPRLPDGTLVDVQSGDTVTYPDYRGLLQERLITNVDPVTVMGRLDMLIILAEGV